VEIGQGERILLRGSSFRSRGEILIAVTAIANGDGRYRALLEVGIGEQVNQLELAEGAGFELGEESWLVRRIDAGEAEVLIERSR
jgi:hypothetical protein